MLEVDDIPVELMAKETAEVEISATNFQFFDFAPVVFRAIRSLNGISTRQYQVRVQPYSVNTSANCGIKESLNIEQVQHLSEDGRSEV